MRRIAATLVRVLRRLAGLRDGEQLGRLQIAVYGLLAMVAFVLVVAWISGTPLDCLAGGVCAR